VNQVETRFTTRPLILARTTHWLPLSVISTKRRWNLPTAPVNRIRTVMLRVSPAFSVSGKSSVATQAQPLVPPTMRTGALVWFFTS